MSYIFHSRLDLGTLHVLYETWEEMKWRICTTERGYNFKTESQFSIKIRHNNSDDHK